MQTRAHTGQHRAPSPRSGDGTWRTGTAYTHHKGQSCGTPGLLSSFFFPPTLKFLFGGKHGYLK